ncbi:unnamed protein product [Mortierella alpina]
MSTSHSPADQSLIQISPQQFHFYASRVPPGQIAKLRLKNLSTESIGYKFKTNAPSKYSVKPVLGALAPGETLKIFVRSESWISPQDRFLLQTVALTQEEVSDLSTSSWKILDHKRFVEHFIKCSSPSALSLGDPEDDAGTLSSSSAASSHRSRSSSYTPPFSAIDLSRERPRQQVFERWQFMEATRPTISIGGVGRRLSSTSSTCSSATSSPGSYPSNPTLFTSSRRSFDYYPQSPSLTATSNSALSSKRNSVSSTVSGSQFLVQQHHPPRHLPDPTMTMPSVIAEEPSSLDLGPSFAHSGGRFWMLLGLSEEHGGGIMDLFRCITKTHMLVLSLLCLLVGLLVPL